MTLETVKGWKKYVHVCEGYFRGEEYYWDANNAENTIGRYST
jgi:hypothetical protein